MKILASSDIHHLEELLLERIDRCALEGRGLASLLVLVPTTRLAQHLKRRILERRRATLGVQILTHHGFATRALEHALETPPRILPSGALVQLLAGVLTGLPREEASYLRQHTGALRALASTFEELREAAINASRLGATAGREAAPWLADVYARFEAGLEKLAPEGWTDAPGLVRGAIPHAERFITRKKIRAIVHHGAYELTGANIQLIEALDRVVEVEFLLPCEIGPPAHRYAERFVELLERRGTTPRVNRGPGAGGRSTDWIRRLCGLYTEQAQTEETRRELESGPGRATGPAPPGRPARPPAAGLATQLDWITDLAPADDEGQVEPESSSRASSRASSRPDAPTNASPQGPRLESRSTQGTQAELRAAVLRALALHGRDGVPWHEIAIVARSLEPYAPFLEHTFESLGVPFTTSASLPLGRARGVSTFLRLLRVYARDFERGEVVALLRHGGLRLAGEPPAASDIDRWDRLSRESRIVGHLPEWRELASGGTTETNGRVGSRQARVPSEDEQRSLEKLPETLDDLARDAEAWQRAKTFEEHAEVLETIAHRRLALSDRGAAERDARVREDAAVSGPETTGALDGHLSRIFTIVHALRDTRHATGAAGDGLQMRQVLRWLEDAASETSLQIDGGDDGGVRVLDLMQARGLSHRAVQWLGFHHGGFPRVGHADPYLPDAARSALRDATDMPLGLELESDEEERLLLSMTLASAGELLCLSSQRADEAGRKRARSTALREIARVFTGRSDVRRLEAAPAPESRDRGFDHRHDNLPVHCGERALILAGSPRFGILPAMDVVVAAAVGAPGPVRQAGAMLKAVGVGSPDRDAALEWLSHVEDFRGTEASGRLDGLTGRGIDEDRELSSTGLEQLTGCPQAFFLRYVLGVRELDEEAEPHRIEVRLLGTAVHDTLEALYGRLRDREAFRSSRGEATAMALELLPGLWSAALERVAGPSFRRLRGLVRRLAERWLESLSRFVVKDMEAILDAEVEPVGFESACRAVLALDETTDLKAFGRFDRVLRGRERTFVDDYKTAGNLPAKTSPGSFLQGKNLQLPLYREIIASATGAAPESVHARCLGVGPDFDDDRRSEAELGWDPDVRAGFLETLAVCLELARGGRFPLNATSSRCSYCAYRSTCRRSHEPTLERLGHDPSLRDYFDLRGKTRSETTLKEVRRKRSGGETGMMNDEKTTRSE